MASAIRGKRGQRLLVDLLAALDAMPVKALIVGDLVTADGEVCALGALGRAKGMNMAAIDSADPPQVASAFDIAESLAQEIMFMNDEYFEGRWDEQLRKTVPMTDEERWVSMRAWVAANIKSQSTVTQ